MICPGCGEQADGRFCGAAVEEELVERLYVSQMTTSQRLRPGEVISIEWE